MGYRSGEGVLGKEVVGLVGEGLLLREDIVGADWIGDNDVGGLWVD
jgi:hypothetical protein